MSEGKPTPRLENFRVIRARETEASLFFGCSVSELPGPPKMMRRKHCAGKNVGYAGTLTATCASPIIKKPTGRTGPLDHLTVSLAAWT